MQKKFVVGHQRVKANFVSPSGRVVPEAPRCEKFDGFRVAWDFIVVVSAENGAVDCSAHHRVSLWQGEG